MKVLKEGRPQQGWSTEVVCTGMGNGGGGCGALLLVEQPDLFKTYRVCRDETDTFITFKCGACGTLSDLSEHRPPHSVQRALPSQSDWEKKNKP